MMRRVRDVLGEESERMESVMFKGEEYMICERGECVMSDGR